MARILLVDDDDRLREATRMVLESAGHEVDEARDGAAALNAYRAQRADVVVCDMFMPGQDGIETIRALRREFPEVKVVAVSGGGFSGSLDVLTLARHMGAAEMLTKPFSRARLLAAVERLQKS